VLALKSPLFFFSLLVVSIPMLLDEWMIGRKGGRNRGETGIQEMK
jgi:SNF family Na+-dependent transporter